MAKAFWLPACTSEMNLSCAAIIFASPITFVTPCKKNKCNQRAARQVKAGALSVPGPGALPGRAGRPKTLQ